MAGLIEKAQKDRYIFFDQKRKTVTYLPHGKIRSLENPEEQVQLNCYLELIYKYGYPAGQIKVCEPVKMGSSTKEADIIVYKDAACKSPCLVVECKKEGISESVFAEAIEQGFSYAITTGTPYIWVTSGEKHAYFEVWPEKPKERRNNRLPDLPAYKKNNQLLFRLRTLVFRGLHWPGIFRALNALRQNPLATDTIIYSLAITIFMVIFSKITVHFFTDFYQITKFLWLDYHMHFGWIYNFLALAATLVGVLLANKLLVVYKLLPAGNKQPKWLIVILVALVFAPAWYIGVATSTRWWNFTHYNSLAFKTFIYLIPFGKALPLQMALIFSLLWGAHRFTSPKRKAIR